MKYQIKAKGVPEISTLAASTIFFKRSDNVVGACLEETQRHSGPHYSCSNAIHRCDTSTEQCQTTHHV